MDRDRTSGSTLDLERRLTSKRGVSAMKRSPQLVLLSWDHHHGLVLALRIRRELAGADATALGRLLADLLLTWDARLLPHFRVEQECLLARLVRHVSSDDELITRTLGDHLSMAALVATMRDRPDPEVRRDAIHRFGEALRTHIRWEEEVLFEATQRRPQELLALDGDTHRAPPRLSPARPWSQAADEFRSYHGDGPSQRRHRGSPC